MLWVIGASERQPCESKVAPKGAAPESTIALALARYSSQVAGAASGRPALRGEARMPAGADHVEQERPAIELAVDRVLLADRRDDVVEHVLRDVVVPGLDDVGLDHRRHFDERRLADIDVPGALLVLRLGDEALDAEALDRRDLVVDAGELARSPAGCWDEGRRSTGRRSASAAGPARRPMPMPFFAAAPTPASPRPATRLRVRNSRLSIVPAQQLPACRLLQEVFLFLPHAHRHPQDWSLRDRAHRDGELSQQVRRPATTIGVRTEPAEL